MALLSYLDERREREAVQPYGQPMMNTAQRPQQAMPQQAAPQQGFLDKLGSGLSNLGGGVKDYLSDPSNRARLAAAFNTMRLNPDPNITQMAQSRIESERMKTGANRTAERFRQMGRPDLADAIEQNPSMAVELLKAYYGQEFKSPSSFAEKVSALVGSGMSEADATKQVISSGGTTVNMPTVGSIPAGYQAEYDEAGRVVKMSPIAGGPVATEVETTEQMAKKNYEAYRTGIANLSEAFGMSNTGSLVGLLPALTSGDLSFEGMRDVMLQPLKSIFRGKGEGTFTDADAAQLLNMMPTRRDTEESARFKLQAADQIIRAKLGLPLSDKPKTIKRYNPATRQIEEVAQ